MGIAYLTVVIVVVSVNTGSSEPTPGTDVLLNSTGDLDTNTVVILGLFELSSKEGDRSEGWSELAAARLAVCHVNQQGIIPGYRLELVANDTKCDAGVGVDAFFHALYKQTHVTTMLLGTACDHVTQSLARVVPYWNMVQVSFGSTSPTLSDRREFPLFYRTVAPDSSHNPARTAFIRHCGWDTISAFSQDEDVYSLAVNDLVTQLEQVNITCRATITFAETSFEEEIRHLGELDTRIIIGSFSHDVAPHIFCEAFRRGMYGGDYTWILPAFDIRDWGLNGTSCAPHELAVVTNGLLLVSSHNSIVGREPSISGLTNAMFVGEFDNLSMPVTRYTAQSYDAVWSIALGLRGAQRKWAPQGDAGLQVNKFHYGRSDMAQEFFTQVGKVNFLGVSGPVSFSGADRVGISAFHQIQDGVVRKVALFYPETETLDFLCPDCWPLVWPDGQAPVSKRVVKIKIISIEPLAFVVICCLACLGIILALALLAFNLHFRNFKSIKLSSPQLNNMTVVGCILVYIGVIVLGLDNATLPSHSFFPVICSVRVYLFSGGFSLAFGSMFTKTYRVHRIFTSRGGNEVVKEKLLQDRQLISLVCCLLFIDSLVATVWFMVDPMQRHLRNLTIENSTSDRSVIYQTQLEVCQSHYTHIWLGSLYIYKGLLLLVGVYMAWETRHVTIPALNDSQYIGISVYSVVITSAIVVLLANFISERATVAFLTITTLILTSTSGTLCLLFMPKLSVLLGQMDQVDPIVESLGLKIECNTRRFVNDDRRELYYRAEVQNRVYRRELTALDREVERLKTQLQSPTHSCASASSIEPTPRKEESRLGGLLVNGVFSALQPLVPRGSWPHAGVIHIPLAFSSQPKLDEESVEDEQSKKGGLLNHFRHLLVNIPTSRKLSTTSLSGSVSALRVRKRQVQNVCMDQMESCCNATVSEETLSRVCSGPIITHHNDDESTHLRMMSIQQSSLTMNFESEEIINTRKGSTTLSHGQTKILHQLSQPIFSIPESNSGTPIFPNKIIPTRSLNTLQDSSNKSPSFFVVHNSDECGVVNNISGSVERLNTMLR